MMEDVIGRKGGAVARNQTRSRPAARGKLNEDIWKKKKGKEEGGEGVRNKEREKEEKERVRG